MAPEPSLSVDQTGAGQVAPWSRLLYMIGFAIAADVLLWVIILLAAVQFILAKVNGTLNPRLLELTDKITRYFREIVAFLCFNQSAPPYPFAPFPRAGGQ